MHVVPVCGLLLTTGTDVNVLIQGHDQEDQHEKANDDHGRRDGDFRLPACQCLLRLPGLCCHRAELLSASGFNGTRRPAQIDPGARSNFLHGGMFENTQNVCSVGRNARDMLLQCRIDRRLRRSVRPLGVDAWNRSEYCQQDRKNGNRHAHA